MVRDLKKFMTSNEIFVVPNIQPFDQIVAKLSTEAPLSERFRKSDGTDNYHVALSDNCQGQHSKTKIR
jgi:hypothetical protein